MPLHKNKSGGSWSLKARVALPHCLVMLFEASMIRIELGQIKQLFCIVTDQLSQISLYALINLKILNLLIEIVTVEDSQHEELILQLPKVKSLHLVEHGLDRFETQVLQYGADLVQMLLDCIFTLQRRLVMTFIYLLLDQSLLSLCS